MRVILIALSILTGCAADTSAQSTTIVAVPAALSEALAEYGCLHIITDEVEVLRNRRRWWVSLRPLTGGDADFAFYCQTAADELSFRLVVVVRGKNNPWQGCDAIVDFWRERPQWFPDDLAIVNAPPQYRRHMDLSRWWLVSSSRNPKVTHGPAGVKIPDPIIDTTADGGAGTLYGCYSGQWYRIGLD